MPQVTIPTEPNTRLTVQTRSLAHRRPERHAEIAAETRAKQVPATESEIAEGFNLAAKFLLATTHASGVAIAILDETGLHCRASAGEAPQSGTAIRLENTISGECIRSGASFHCDDTLTKCPNALPARSILLLPIVWGRNTRGLVALFSRQPQAFGQASVAIARSAAAMVAIALNAWSPQLDCPIDGQVLEAEIAEPAPPTPALAAAPVGAPPVKIVAPADTTEKDSPLAPEWHGRLSPSKVLCGLPCATCGSYSAATEPRCPVCKTAK
jgi:GAF domain-containing protein